MRASRPHFRSLNGKPRSLLVTAACCLSAAGVCADQLTVDVTGITIVSGNIRAAVFDSREHWEDEKSPVASVSESVKKTEVRLVFADLPAGDYAVKLYQDENSNGKLDTNMLGIPSERYGFSRQQPRRGQPSFDEAKFSVEGDTRIAIPIK